MYFYSTIESFLPRYYIVIVCHATRLFMCCLSVFVCAALFFIWALKATPIDLAWPCFACCLFCFVSVLVSHRKRPSPSCPTRTARSSSPLGPVRLLHTAHVASTSTPGRPTLCLEQLQKAKTISTIEAWTSAFLIFVGIYSSRFAAEAAALMKYGEVVRDLANKGANWIY